MIKKHTASAIITALIFSSTVAYTEVYNCNGTYSNMPCSKPQTSADSKQEDAAKAHEKQLKKISSQKKSLTHELAMKAIKANREYKLSYNTAIVEEYCASPEISVIDCNNKVSELSEKIDDRIASLEEIKAQKKANELSEEKLKQDEKNKIVIINQQYYERRRRPDYYRTPRAYTPQTQTEINANINLKSKDGTKQISGGISSKEKQPESPLYTNDSVIKKPSAGAEFRKAGN